MAHHLVISFTGACDLTWLSAAILPVSGRDLLAPIEMLNSRFRYDHMTCVAGVLGNSTNGNEDRGPRGAR